MAADGTSKEFEVSLPMEWVFKKTLGPTLEEVGLDLQKLYSKGRDKIVSSAVKKIQDIDDGRRANLRVARDIFSNGAFTDEEVCAEYFGGLLASSRSMDGKDDNAMPFLDTIRALSSSQLRLHYAVYRSLNILLSQSGEYVNIFNADDISSHEIWMPSLLIERDFSVNTLTDGTVLNRHGLLNYFKLDNQPLVEDSNMPYLQVRPTTYGTLLYCAAHNRLSEWKNFSISDFGEFSDLGTPVAFASNLPALLERLQLKQQA